MASRSAADQGEDGQGDRRRGPRGQRVRNVPAQTRTQDVDESEQHDSPREARRDRGRPKAVARPEPLDESHADEGRNGQLRLVEGGEHAASQAADRPAGNGHERRLTPGDGPVHAYRPSFMALARRRSHRRDRNAARIELITSGPATQRITSAGQPGSPPAIRVTDWTAREIPSST